MKKRIIAILLALSIFFMSLSCGKRASADPATLAVTATICMASILIMNWVTSGQIYKDAENFTNFVIEMGESFEYVFTGENVYDYDGTLIYHSDSEWQVGVGQIANKLQSWFNKGELKIEDGKFSLTAEQYHELYRQAVNVMAKPGVDFDAGFDCRFLSVDTSIPVLMSDLPLIEGFYNTYNGQSYSLVYFNNDRIIFSDYYVYFRTYGYSSMIACRSTTISNLGGGISGFTGQTSSQVFDNCRYAFTMPDLSTLNVSFLLANNMQNHNIDLDHCYIFENGTLTYTSIDDLDYDLSAMTSGLVTTTGDYPGFLNSLTGFSDATISPDFSNADLDGVIPDTSTLTFPLNPDKDIPLADQITVGSVPGVSDLPLSAYQGELNIDIDVPTIIVDKFPFCIPFDFIRFLGLLCSDPVAPVFRIPFSTHPDNLEQWADNETFGDYINPDSPPMFEIDEEIVIDLSHIPLVQGISYTCFIVGFIFLLLHITPKMIQH